MRHILRRIAVFAAMIMASMLLILPTASAQDLGEVLADLEDQGYHLGLGSEGIDSAFQDLVRKGEQTGEQWYFVAVDVFVDVDFANILRDEVQPQGNVVVLYVDNDGFYSAQLASDESEDTEFRALSPLESDWLELDDVLGDVVDEFESITAAGISSSSGTSSSSGPSSSSGGSGGSGGGFPWGIVAVPAVLGGGFWFMRRRGKNKQAEEDLETAQKIRAELETEIGELANDVLVLSGPTDLSDKDQAIAYYREATDTYLDIADELPDLEELMDADLEELSELGARVAHARWQMDAAEAIMDGEEIPEKPKVEPPPPAPTTRQRTPEERQLPNRQPRPRVPYSPSRRRSGGGLLDVLIAGAGMMNRRSSRSRSRRRGGFGSSSSSSRNRRTTPSSGRGSSSRGSSSRGGSSRGSSGRGSSGGGVFGRSSRSRSSSRSSTSRRSTSRRSNTRRRSSGSRTRSRASGSRRSTSRRSRRRR